MVAFNPKLSVLPPPTLRLWEELTGTPEHFTLSGGTALALRLGHRSSADFVFRSNEAFDPDELARRVAYLAGAERVQVALSTLTCRVERRGPVLVSFFGGLRLGQVAPRERLIGTALHVASLFDLAGTKAALVQKRAELRDYVDLDALTQHGVDLATALAAGHAVYGRDFNPLITLKALSCFDDVPGLAAEVRDRLAAAVAAVDPLRLPVLVPYAARPGLAATR